MSMSEPRATAELRSPEPGSTIAIQWGPIIAGALAAAALAFVLHGFAGAIGLSVSSTAPTWRDASFALVFLTGLYLVLVALAAYSLGGYTAGRMRTRLGAGRSDEIEFRDGMHGIAVWALATLLTGLLVLAAAAPAARLGAPSAGASGPAASVGAENIVAYDLDKLLRGTRPEQQASLDYARAEAGRILLTAASHRGVMPEDRAYLIRMVAARTGISEEDATRRVDVGIAQAKENISRARRSAVLIAFMAGAAALAGAAAAWFAACLGGRHRDHTLAPNWLWSSREITSIS